MSLQKINVEKKREFLKNIKHPRYAGAFGYGRAVKCIQCSEQINPIAGLDDFTQSYVM